MASEITWITETQPSELEKYWNIPYPEIGMSSTKIRVLENHGYAPLGYFVLPEQCWLDGYLKIIAPWKADRTTDGTGSPEPAPLDRRAEPAILYLFSE